MPDLPPERIALTERVDAEIDKLNAATLTGYQEHEIRALIERFLDESTLQRAEIERLTKELNHEAYRGDKARQERCTAERRVEQLEAEIASLCSQLEKKKTFSVRGPLTL